MVQDKERIRTYKNLNNWQSFRLKLVLEGLLVGLFSGLLVGFFRYALTVLERQRLYIYRTVLEPGPLWYVAIVLAVVLLIAAILEALVKYEPMSAGSGIPQVKGNILGIYKTTWWRIIIAKLAGGILGIGAGLSLGREGPSIQLGAMMAQGISRLLGRTKMEEKYLITSGAGAGLAAAFNAPLAGVIFTMEELHKNFSAVVLMPSLAAALVSTVVSHIIFGRNTIFSFPELSRVPIRLLPTLVIVGICLGVLGAFFNYCLVNASKFYQLPFFKNNFMRIAFPLFLAVILGFYLPQVLSGGNLLVDSLVTNNFPLKLLLLFLVGKFIFTMLSYGANVPGGFFLPMLVLGALAGNILANIFVSIGILDSALRMHVIIFAMAGFFAASVRAPITGIILIMEMTGSFWHLVPLSLVALFAYITAELCHSKPIYDSLLDKALAKDKEDSRKMVKKTTRNIMERVVESGTVIEGKFIKDIEWPQGVLVVDVKRGDKDIIPRGDTRLMAGDYLYILVAAVQEEAVIKMMEKLK